jgi:hypothetical protein
MYDILPSFVLGFHGCDHAVAEKIFAGESRLQPSENDYDWLGHGVYFWENNPQRALEYARQLHKNPKQSRQQIKSPAVIGAVVDLGLCLNLLDSQFIQMLKESYAELVALHEVARTRLPVNRSVGESRDLLLRPLDCAVIECLHHIRTKQEKHSFDSIRGAFVEGEPVYPGAGVHEFNHIQICVRNPRCIKGYFRVLSEPLLSF